jgi:hypothetical protein
MSKPTRYRKCRKTNSTAAVRSSSLAPMMHFTNVTPLFGSVVPLVAAGLHARFRTVTIQ